MGTLIFTTVGTSVFQKFFKSKPNYKEYYDYNILNSDIFDYSQDNEIKKLKKAIIDHCKQNYPANLNKTSAEIQSLYQMTEEHLIDPKSDDLILLYSDTLEGLIVADIMEEFFNETNDLKFQEIKKEKMINIRGDSADKFIKGLENFQLNIKGLSKGYEKIILNFTGGYKGVVPALTIFNSHLIDEGKECGLYYLYEETDRIIKFVLINGEIVASFPNGNNNLIDNF